MNLQNKLDKIKLPNHLAIIMDGNGRWAKQKGLLRAIGHENGTKSVRSVVEACAELNIPFLTLYAFSTENWNRPKREVELLMKLLVSSLKKEIKTLQDNDIKLSAIGNLDALPKKSKHRTSRSHREHKKQHEYDLGFGAKLRFKRRINKNS
jgi:undecaprenyl diphosphate synthase